MGSDVNTVNVSRALAVGVFGLFVLLGILLMRPGGIGGTGIGDGEGNGGIGGTGIGTGFIGRIDRFGSIWVNGTEIFYAKDIPVSFNGRTGLSSELKIGHVVQLVAMPDNNGILHATSLNVRYEVIGKVKALNQNTAKIFTDTVVFPIDGNFQPVLGDKVAVSGFRRSDGVVMASRLDIIFDGQPGKAYKLLQPFAGQVEALSISGYAQQEADGYSLYGYKIDTVPERFSLNDLVKITAKTGTNDLRDVTIHQAIVPKLSPPSAPKPEIVPQDVPRSKRLQAPVPLPKQKAPKKPSGTPPIKPQPIRREIPTIDKPERQNSLIVPIPIQRQDAQPPVRPLAEPETQLPDALPQQREIEGEGSRVSDEEQVEQLSDPDLLEQSTGEPNIAEQPEEPDIPERDVVTPERETRPEQPTRTDIPDRIERPERPDRVEKPERPERPERPR